MEEAPRAINQEECLSPASFRHLVAVLRSFFIGFQSERQIFCREALKCATCVLWMPNLRAWYFLHKRQCFKALTRKNCRAPVQSYFFNFRGFVRGHQINPTKPYTTIEITTRRAWRTQSRRRPITLSPNE